MSLRAHSPHPLPPPQGDDPGKLAENFAKTYGLDAEMKAQVPATYMLYVYTSSYMVCYIYAVCIYAYMV